MYPIASARRLEVTAVQPSASAMARAASRICCLRSATRCARAPLFAMVAPLAFRLATTYVSTARKSSGARKGSVVLATLAVITATVLGVMVGVEFAVAVFVNPILLRLPVGSWIEASADGGRVLGTVMPFWYIGSLLLTAWLAAVKWGGPAGDAAVAAAALLAVSVVMSITLLVPINNRSKTWTADNHPADWREQNQRWDRLHYARVAIIIAGFVLTLVAGTVA